MVPDSTTPHGMALIIIQDPGHGDLILDIPHISVGDLAGVIVPVGSASDLVSDMVMDMDTAIAGAGGDLHFIIPQFGVDGAEDPGLMVSMAGIFRYGTTSM